jgi:hypothetical protein
MKTTAAMEEIVQIEDFPIDVLRSIVRTLGITLSGRYVDASILNLFWGTKNASKPHFTVFPPILGSIMNLPEEPFAPEPNRRFQQLLSPISLHLHSTDLHSAAPTGESLLGSNSWK